MADKPFEIEQTEVFVGKYYGIYPEE